MRRLLGTAVSCMLIGVVGIGWLGLQEAGLSHGHGRTAKPGVRFVETFTDDDGRVDRPSRDPGDDGTDPGHDKRVGLCQARIDGPTLVRVDLVNVYPGYSCEVWVRFKNVGNTTLRGEVPGISAPEEVTVLERNPPGCLTLKPGKSGWRSFQIRIQQGAQSRTDYRFTIDLKFVSLKSAGGCP